MPRRSNAIFAFFVVAVGIYIAWGCGKRESEENAQSAASKIQYAAITVANGGTITGKVRISGQPPVVPDLIVVHDNGVCGSSKPSPRLACNAEGSVKDAVVYLVGIHNGKPFSLPSQPVEITQKGCMYLPHIGAVPSGATVAFRNDDHVLHSIHLFLDERSFWNEAQPIFGQTNLVKLNSPGIVRMQCDAGHIWMSGYVFVADNPYFALTDADGNFSLADVPPGTYTLACWHEGWNAAQIKNNAGEITAYAYDAPYLLRRQITVGPSDTARVNFMIQPH